ncbi:D-xylulokinase [Suhomyces tanzawaensis NRRL Y-17324]|uniref:Xylulose kinase n=1 Tax=Suhomyces tanzawaensis NRRL Y-17324 TaxID=984487 RepID=A0A1E4SG84_9ASCO|nr:D-xylulokinase [Suhomyces tanzawaensis NRRL Y-17324]ODV78524.1 D-xylulokinase [Suhomyces tanzawaensis NRRL Y-17324]
MAPPLFLGFDLSTQQLKVIVTDANLNHLHSYHVEFDAAYKQRYGIHKGVLVDDDTIVSPVLMWLDAVDHVFDQMKQDAFPFADVRGISGSGQQHGSIYWSQQAEHLLQSLDGSGALSDQLQDAFTFQNSPNWQDHSTGSELKGFEDTVGADELAQISGSRAHYRFTGLQIRKLATRIDPERYASTWRISLVSSFVASVLLGKIAPIEEADACGMNLYDIQKGEYDERLLALAAGVHPQLDGTDPHSSKYRDAIDQLRLKLGEISPISYNANGTVSPHFQKKYGFASDCKVYSFTGDNLATILSLPLAPNDCLISLGTSTTVLIITKNYNPSSQYHLFKHPTMPDHYMGMLCYCNGSLAREKVRDEINTKYNIDNKSWDKFDELLDGSTDFNGKLGIYFPLGEIIPNAAAQTKRSMLVDGTIEDLEIGEKWTVEDDVSSIVESQTLSCRLRSGPMLSGSGSSGSSTTPEPTDEARKMYDDLIKKHGELSTDGKKHTFESITSKPNRCYYAGGASNNTSIIKKMGSILAPINGNYRVEIPNACALGGAFKASWSYACEEKNEWIGYEKYINQLFEVNDDLEPFEVENKWSDYLEGVALLARMEETLKH